MKFVVAVMTIMAIMAIAPKINRTGYALYYV